MKHLIYILVVSLFSLNALALKNLNSGEQSYSFKVKGEISYKVVEVSMACIHTYDPQWAEDVDTRDVRLVYEDYQDSKQLDEMEKYDGYRFAKMLEGSKCEVGDSTFPAVKTKDGKLYFSKYVEGKVLAQAAKQQNAFKSVKVLLVQDLDSVKKSAEKSAEKAMQDILDLF